MGLDAYIYSHTAPERVAYWRKNAKLDEWMANKWHHIHDRDHRQVFNLQRLYLTPELIDDLRQAIRDGDLGFDEKEKRAFLSELLLFKDDIELNKTVYYYTNWW
tara:strand:+ start:1526 stop:1837 length:312 start_codon:yes stop_codon:yes gene_type:complete